MANASDSSTSNLRCPVRAVKKSSGPLDEALKKLETISIDEAEQVGKTEDIRAEKNNAVVVNACNFTSPCSSKHRLIGEKKRERWLLTRKTWKYMADAGRKLIPESAQNRKDDIPKIEEHFQQVCAAESHFLPWNRKLSYPGATHNGKRRLKQLLMHNSRYQQQLLQRRQEEAQTADHIIEWLQSYLGLDEAFKTTTLLGTKTVRPDQTSSPSAKRPSVINSVGNNGHSSSLYQGRQNTATHQSFNELDILKHLQMLNGSSTMQSFKIPSDKITSAILEDKVLLKQIYNSLKKQQLHRIFNTHSRTIASTKQNPETQHQQHFIKHASSVNSLLHLDNTNFDYVDKKEALSIVPKTLRANEKNINSSKCGSIAKNNQTKPPSTYQFVNGDIDVTNITNKQKVVAERQFNSCSTQTNFIQLFEIKRLAEEYKHSKQTEYTQVSPNTGTDEESEQRHGYQHRKSSIDNEDISQSVSNTIKRYLRMARKKSVHDADASRFKRVNYDRNLRNIRAKGEIILPGMDEDNNKAVQTLDAWPVITLAYIRGVDCESILASAHAEWQCELDERIKRKNEYENNLQNKNNASSTVSVMNQSSHSSDGNAVSALISPMPADQHSYDSSNLKSPRLSNNGASTLNTGISSGNHVNASGLLHSSSQFLSNLWHGAITGEQNSRIIGNNNDNGAVNNSKGSKNTSTMHKSKSSFSVGQSVSRNVLRNRSKSQTRPDSTQYEISQRPLSKWTPSGNFTWTSERGECIILTDALLQNLSDIEVKILRSIILQKINELNIDMKINLETHRKAEKRQGLSKKKAMTTSFFDMGKKDESNVQCVFGKSLECCVADDKKRDNLITSTIDRGSRGSLASLHRGTSSSSSDGNNYDSTSEFYGDISSCKSLPFNSNDINKNNKSNGKSSYFGKLKKSSSMPISRNQLNIGCNTDFGNVFNELQANSSSSNSRILQVPHFIIYCIRYLEEYGLHQVGLFRVSTSKKRVQQLRDYFDQHIDATIDGETCPHDVATLFKEFFRDLPEPLLCSNLYEAFLKTQRIRNRRLQLEAISYLVKFLPRAHRDTLYVLLEFLAKVASCSDDIVQPNGTLIINGNKMDSNNLARVFAPNILRTLYKQSHDAFMSSSQIASEKQESINDVINVIRVMIDHYEELFRVPAEVIDSVYAHMLDEYPQNLYTLCEQRSTLDARHFVDEEKRRRHSLETNVKQNQLSANTLQKSTGIMSASLHIPTPIKMSSSKQQQPTYDAAFRAHEDMSHIIDTDACNEHSLDLSSKTSVTTQPQQQKMTYEAQENPTCQTMDNTQPDSDSAKTSMINICFINEPKLPTSITNIGSDILRSKAASFERISPDKKKTIGTTTKKPHLYKRQELISSSNRPNPASTK